MKGPIRTPGELDDSHPQHQRQRSNSQGQPALLSGAFTAVDAPSGPKSGVSLPVAALRAIDMCEARGLLPTAQWLSEMILSASPQVARDSGLYPLLAADPVLDAHSRMLATLGRSLMANKEFARCHELLKVSLPSTSNPSGGRRDGGPRGDDDSSSAAAAMTRSAAMTAPRAGGGGAAGGGASDGRSLSSIRPCDLTEVTAAEEGVLLRSSGVAGTSLLDPSVTSDTPVGFGNRGGRAAHRRSSRDDAYPAADGSPDQRASGAAAAAAGHGDEFEEDEVDDLGDLEHNDSSASPRQAQQHGDPSAHQHHSQHHHHQQHQQPHHPSRFSSAEVLEPQVRSSQLAFLSLYAFYLEGQQRQFTVTPIASRAAVFNTNLRSLHLALLHALEVYPHDGFLLWLLGVVLRESQLKQDAAAAFLQAVRVQPYLWCAWQDMATLVTKETQLNDIAVALKCHARPDANLMFRFFAASVRADLGSFVAATADWEALAQMFPTSHAIRCSLGNCMYHRKEFDAARVLYEGVRHADPHRLEGMDEYSNVLFVRGDRVALSTLAQHCYALDPYRPESNCVVGNYYAIMGRHDKSLFHFRRAVAIDPKYLSAWTLMGHEYLEMKNTSAAVEAYRAAVEIDQRDYRAWYGLGQIYELLHMHHHAMYYYWQTTTLRPADPRMWAAVANCLEQDRRPHEAVQCLERAEQCESSSSDHYPALVRRIAEFYLANGNPRRAVSYLSKLIHCEAKKPEDLLFALPAWIDSTLDSIYQSCDIPTRSPSFDPAAVAHHHAGGRRSGGVSAGIGVRETTGRPSGELRRQEALRQLEECEEYIALYLSIAFPMESDDGSDGPSGNAATPAVGARDATVSHSQMQRYLAQAQSNIAYVRTFLASSHGGGTHDNAASAA